MRCGALVLPLPIDPMTQANTNRQPSDDDRAMQLIAIPAEHLGATWALIAPFAEKIAARFPDEWPVATIAEAAAARDLQLWLVWDANAKRPLGCVGTRIIAKPSGKRILDIAWMAGEDRKRWMSLLAIIEDHARDEGCASVSFVGRRGWAPDLPGYRVKRLAAYEKELNHVAKSGHRRAA